MRFRQIAGAIAVAVVFALAGCGSNEDCQLVCDKSEECGSASESCMESCEAEPPSDACMACYEEENCADVGRCLSSCGG